MSNFHLVFFLFLLSHFTSLSFIGSPLAHAYCPVSWNSKDDGQQPYILCIFIDFTRLKHFNAVFNIYRVTVRVSCRCRPKLTSNFNIWLQVKTPDQKVLMMHLLRCRPPLKTTKKSVQPVTLRSLIVLWPFNAASTIAQADGLLCSWLFGYRKHYEQGTTMVKRKISGISSLGLIE